MEEIRIYPSRLKATILLIINVVFSVLIVVLFDDINSNKGLFHKFLSILGFILFFSGIFLSVKLLLRKEPLLVITSEEILINQILMKPIKIYFRDVKSFEVIYTYHRGFRTNAQIFIEMKKPTEKYKNSKQYKILFWFSPRLANSQYTIQTSFLNINHKKLLEILNKKLIMTSYP